jgi:hypothetical protein
MNHARPFYYGFQATWQSCDAALDRMVVQAFFPWGPVAPETVARGSSVFLRFRETIPSEDMTYLYDDICRFWEREGDEKKYEQSFVEIHGVPPNVTVRLQGHLSPKLASEARILEHVTPHSGLSSADSTAGRWTDPCSCLKRLHYVTLARCRMGSSRRRKGIW